MNEQHQIVANQSKAYPRRCAECGQETVTATTIEYDAEVKHDGKLYKFRIESLRIDKCQACGEEYFTNDTDDQISAGLRDSLGLLQPEVIRRRLSELKILQREFAEHLGVAPESVSRWVTGTAIQTRALDTLMRLYFAFPDVRSALNPGKRLPSLGEGDLETIDCGHDSPSPNDRKDVVLRSVPARQIELSESTRFRRSFEPSILARRHSFSLVVESN